MSPNSDTYTPYVEVGTLKWHISFILPDDMVRKSIQGLAMTV